MLPASNAQGIHPGEGQAFTHTASAHLHRDILTRTGRAFSEGRGKPYKAIYDDFVEGFTERKYREPIQGAIRRFKAVLFEILENKLMKTNKALKSRCPCRRTLKHKRTASIMV